MGITEAAQDISFAAMAKLQDQIAQHRSRRSRGGHGRLVHRRRHLGSSTVNNGRLFVDAEAARRAQGESARKSSRDCAGSVVRSPGITLFLQARCRTSASAAADEQGAVPVRPAGDGTSRSSTTGRRSWSRALRQDAATQGREQRPADARLADECRRRSRRRRAPRRVARGYRQHALRRLRPAAGLDDLQALQPAPRHPRGDRRSISATRLRWRKST